MGQSMMGGWMHAWRNGVLLAGECLLLSWFAHRAGLTGLLLAAMTLHSGASAPVKHLRTVNPYVAAALSDWRRHCSLSASMPRQCAPAVTASAAERAPVAGTSSFGMSGVNAHALVMAATFPEPQLHATAKVTRQ